MHKIIVEKECGCFKKSDFENNKAIESKDEALTESLNMVNVMNSDFCGKHNFKLQEVGNDFVIAFSDSTSNGCCGNGCGSH
ncbi:MAG: hypothetical protein U9N02_05595 [Campylobacterota bacterium]|nr:hypothetical protein [Campylobacterota bacterium]